MNQQKSSIITEGSVNPSSKMIEKITSEDISPPPSPIRDQKLQSRWTHNPLVLSMFACSTMQSCDEVKEVYRECIKNNDQDGLMCEAAAKYYKMCHMSNGGNNDVLSYNPYHEE
mmetsp:Transcript_3524/g.4678  ORF Transcript_3524/g.4678 Transcript_3524/m.4678 type:complete len:114 (+) Transcript_3524:106-447(+)